MSLAWEKPCRSFSLEAIQKATENFNESNFIGRGGFGKVYKGLIHDGLSTTDVAVKRWDRESNQGVGEFQTEIKMLSRFRHCHLICLVGYCDEHPEMILVYEFMSNGTLADRLYKNQHSQLTWAQRLKICTGAARGLDYLHTGTGLEDRVIHLDVKCANILLDHNFAAKIADMGLSKTGPANQQYSEVFTNHIQGTKVYVDPDFLKSNKFSRKADVYAFGVVLLEVLTGVSAMNDKIFPRSALTDLASWTRQHISKRTLYEIIDASMADQIEPNCLEIFANTACKSLHSDPKKRPTMTEVVAQLESALASQKNTNPSTSMIDDDLLQHFGKVGSDSNLKATSEHVSFDNEESLDRHGVVAEPGSEDLIDLEGNIFRFLGNQTNIFGKPITNKTMVQMGLNPTRKNKAKIAYRSMNLGDKYDLARRFVEKNKFTMHIDLIRCLLYNAAGETLYFVASHASHSRGYVEPSLYPQIILNGQWVAYQHEAVLWVKNPLTSFSTIVVYRGKDSETYYVLAWSLPWQYVTQKNAAYCEINEVGHFDDAFWEAIYGKLQSAGLESSVRWKDCYTKVTIDGTVSGFMSTPIFTAIITHVDAITTSVEQI